MFSPGNCVNVARIRPNEVGLSNCPESLLLQRERTNFTFDIQSDGFLSLTFSFLTLNFSHHFWIIFSAHA